VGAAKRRRLDPPEDSVIDLTGQDEPATVKLPGPKLRMDRVLTNPGTVAPKQKTLQFGQQVPKAGDSWLTKLSAQKNEAKAKTVQKKKQQPQ